MSPHQTRTPTSKAFADPSGYHDDTSPLSPLESVREAYRDGYRAADGAEDLLPPARPVYRAADEDLPPPKEKRVSFEDDKAPSLSPVPPPAVLVDDPEGDLAEADADRVFRAELDTDFRETRGRCEAAEAAAEYAEELAAETAHAMENVLKLAQDRIDDAQTEIWKLEETLAAERASRKKEVEGAVAAERAARKREQAELLAEMVRVRRDLVAADRRAAAAGAGGDDAAVRNEIELDEAIRRLSLLQWLGEGNWTGHLEASPAPSPAARKTHPAIAWAAEDQPRTLGERESAARLLRWAAQEADTLGRDSPRGSRGRYE